MATAVVSPHLGVPEASKAAPVLSAPTAAAGAVAAACADADSKYTSKRLTFDNGLEVW